MIEMIGKRRERRAKQGEDYVPRNRHRDSALIVVWREREGVDIRATSVLIAVIGNWLSPFSKSRARKNVE
jgi:hypothetical protein